MYELATRAAALTGVVVLSPVMVAIALLVLLETGAPVLFRQNRMGLRGRMFQLLKFRSMYASSGGTRITARGEARITPLGGLLRRYKLDELPQLINVVRGEMSLVGPRPEVPEFVDLNDSRWQEVLSVRPGITDPATVAFRNEEELLAGVEDVEEHYRKVILPRKLELTIDYLARRSAYSDLMVILQTVGLSWLPEMRRGNHS